MGLGIRKYIARKISEIDEPEVFQIQRRFRQPTTSQEVVEPIPPGIVDHPLELNYKMEPTKLEYTGKFFVDKSNDDYNLVVFPKVKSGPIFFVLKRVKSSPIFFTIKRTTLSRPDLFSTLYIEGTYSPEIVKFEVDTDIVNLLDFGVEIGSMECTIPVPEYEIEDILTTFMPTIEKIDLLDQNSISFEESTVIYDPKTSFDLPKPDVVFSEYSDMDISTFGPMFYYQEFNFKDSKNFLIKDTLIDSSGLTFNKQNNIYITFSESRVSHDSNLIDDPLESQMLFRSLEPVYELTPALKSDILAPLLFYQQEGAEFLFNSDLAFFYDDFELGKEMQSLFALKMLLRIRAVKKCLIITSNYRDLIIDSRDKNLPKGIWHSGIQALLPTFACENYTNANEINSIDNFDNVINLIPYRVLEDCLEHGKISIDDLNIFNCLIFDDICDDVINLKAINNLKSDLICKYIWFLSDFENPSYIEKISGLFPGKELKTLARQKHSANQAPEKIYYDFVLDIDSDNSKIPNDLLYDAKGKIELLVESGNLMRIQPAMYQLVHDTQRKTNFNLNDPSYGNKTKLLKYNIDRILNRYDRVLIYSQFDDSGIQQISEFLGANEIEFMTFDLGDSAKNISDKLAQAKSYQGKLVYLTNLKQKGLFFKFPDVSHLINFDNWWNPISRYSIEDNVNPGTQKTITVYNYYLDETFEYELLYKLYELGLRDKNVISSLTIDNFYNIISESIWCEIIGIQTSENAAVGDTPDGENAEQETAEPAVEEEKFPINSLKDLVNYSEIFLKKLRFTGIDSQIEILNYSYNITAKFNKTGEQGKVLAKVVYAQTLSPIYIREIIKDHVGEGDDSKTFLITSGIIEDPMTVLPQNLTLIDGEKLKSYMKVLEFIF